MVPREEQVPEAPVTFRFESERSRAPVAPDSQQTALQTAWHLLAAPEQHPWNRHPSLKQHLRPFGWIVAGLLVVVVVTLTGCRGCHAMPATPLPAVTLRGATSGAWCQTAMSDKDALQISSSKGEKVRFEVELPALPGGVGLRVSVAEAGWEGASWRASVAGVSAVAAEPPAAIQDAIDVFPLKGDAAPRVLVELVPDAKAPACKPCTIQVQATAAFGAASSLSRFFQLVSTDLRSLDRAFAAQEPLTTALGVTRARAQLPSADASCRAPEIAALGDELVKLVTQTRDGLSGWVEVSVPNRAAGVDAARLWGAFEKSLDEWPFAAAVARGALPRRAELESLHRALGHLEAIESGALSEAQRGVALAWSRLVLAGSATAWSRFSPATGSLSSRDDVFARRDFVVEVQSLPDRVFVPGVALGLDRPRGMAAPVQSSEACYGPGGRIPVAEGEKAGEKAALLLGVSWSNPRVVEKAEDLALAYAGGERSGLLCPVPVVVKGLAASLAAERNLASVEEVAKPWRDAVAALPEGPRRDEISRAVQGELSSGWCQVFSEDGIKKRITTLESYKQQFFDARDPLGEAMTVIGGALYCPNTPSGLPARAASTVLVDGPELRRRLLARWTDLVKANKRSWADHMAWLRAEFGLGGGQFAQLAPPGSTAVDYGPPMDRTAFAGKSGTACRDEANVKANLECAAAGTDQCFGPPLSEGVPPTPSPQHIRLSAPDEGVNRVPLLCRDDSKVTVEAALKEGLGPVLLVRSNGPFILNGVSVGDSKKCRDHVLGAAWCGEFDLAAMYREMGDTPKLVITPDDDDQIFLFSTVRGRGR